MYSEWVVFTFVLALMAWGVVIWQLLEMSVTWYKEIVMAGGFWDREKKKEDLDKKLEATLAKKFSRTNHGRGLAPNGFHKELQEAKEKIKDVSSKRMEAHNLYLKAKADLSEMEKKMRSVSAGGINKELQAWKRKAKSEYIKNINMLALLDEKQFEIEELARRLSRKPSRTLPESQRDTRKPNEIVENARFQLKQISEQMKEFDNATV